MAPRHKLKSGQINYESISNPGAYACIVIRDGEFHNLTEDLRLDLIERLQNTNKTEEPVDIDDMF